MVNAVVQQGNFTLDTQQSRLTAGYIWMHFLLCVLYFKAMLGLFVVCRCVNTGEREQNRLLIGV